MPNNIGPLPLSGVITLQDIADVFYLYLPYTDLNEVNITDYYGDKIAHYYPFYPPIPTTGNPIKVSDFYGKQYLLPITINLSAVPTPIYDYSTATVTLSTHSLDVYAIANGIASDPSSYNIPLNTPDIPFYIIINNNTFVVSDTPTAAAVKISGNFNNMSTIVLNNSGAIIGAASVGGGPKVSYNTFSAYRGVYDVSWRLCAGGGGGGSGQEVGNGGAGGGGGGGGLSHGYNGVKPGDTLTATVGGGGQGGQTSGRGSVANGSRGGDTTLYFNGVFYTQVGGGGGGGGGASGCGGAGGHGGYGYPSGNDGSSGQSGTNDYSSGSGGNGGYPNGGSGASFYDRTYPLGWSGSNGGDGYAIFDYVYHATGGTSLYVRHPIILNNVVGNICGGPAAVASDILGYSIDGLQYITNLPLSGSITGTGI
jgi:hypothetical protein